MQYRIDALLVALVSCLALQCGGEMSDSFAGLAGGGTTSGGANPARAVGGNGVLPIQGGTGSSTLGGTGGSSPPPVAATGGFAIAPAPSCTTQLNLLGGNLGPKNNWIGGVSTSSIDNPCGVQGLIYKFGDAGLDNVPGNADDTCPYLNQDITPCSGGRCCISGTTHSWPYAYPTGYDFTASVWGCGIGISLNDPDNGLGTLPYTGPAKGFLLQLSGTLNGQPYRVGYTQIASVSKSPYVQYTSLLAVSVVFLGVSCPSFGYYDCVTPRSNPYALQLWISGGDVPGDFELCVDAINPIL